MPRVESAIGSCTTPDLPGLQTDGCKARVLRYDHPYLLPNSVHTFQDGNALPQTLLIQELFCATLHYSTAQGPVRRVFRNRR